MKKIKTVVFGSMGRMGQRIVSSLTSDPECEVSACIEHERHKDLGMDIGDKTGLGKTGVLITSALMKNMVYDIAIDFTLPDVTLKNMEAARGKVSGFVIGTTGFSSDQMEAIKRHSMTMPIVLSPNMSIGVNVMFSILKKTAAILGNDYDVEIIEAHHRLKKDAPSGTAMKMAKVLAESLDRDLDKVGVYSRKGIIGERGKNEIGIQTIRAGDIIGEHTVIFGGTGERLEITHRAQNRDNFAKGAVIASKWIIDKSPGLYSMEDVLDIN